jgi:hypothetical protein
MRGSVKKSQRASQVAVCVKGRLCKSCPQSTVLEGNLHKEQCGGRRVGDTIFTLQSFLLLILFSMCVYCFIQKINEYAQVPAHFKKVKTSGRFL